MARDKGFQTFEDLKSVKDKKEDIRVYRSYCPISERAKDNTQATLSRKSKGEVV